MDQSGNRSVRMRMLYCEECQHHIPVEETEDGTVIIHCPKCIGECAACDCHLAADCFSSSVQVIVRRRLTDGRRA